MRLFLGLNNGAASARRLLWVAALAVLGGVLAACGGGGGTSTTGLMVDSFGQVIAETDFGLGDKAASGADGTVSDDVVIANALVQVIDSAGRSVIGKTDALGYYRVRIDGFTPPLVASVTRADGQLRFSPSVTPVKVRGFITVNITSLTDKLASDVAVASGAGGAAQLSPRALAANPTALQTARTSLNAQLNALLKDASLDPASFDPVTLPFRPGVTGYAKVLANVLMTRTALGATVITPFNSVGGTVVGLGNAVGLSLVSGTETLAIPAQTTSFNFGTRLALGTAYSVKVNTQPAGSLCAVNNSSGVMVVPAVTNVQVVCSTNTDTVGGVVSGLGNASGLVLGNGAQSLAIAPGAVGFVFPTPIPRGSTYFVVVQAQPAGLTCSAANAGGTLMGSGPVTTVVIRCSTNSYTLGGTVSGLTGSGLVLLNGDQVTTVAASTATFSFPKPLASGTSYDVSVRSQPAFGTCAVTNGTGTVTTANITSVAVACTAVQGTVSTFAGNGKAAFADGGPATASFHGPVQLAVDGNGVAYVADSANLRIRVLDTAGNVTTLAGDGSSGSKDGAGSAASFLDPQGIAVDKDGNVFVAEPAGNRIRKITPDGVVATFAGSSGTEGGYLDGSGANARFNRPTGVATDSSGNVYVADSANQRIRKITPSGQVSTLAGAGTAGYLDGAGSVANFNAPAGLVVDSGGNVFVTDTGNNRIRKITPAGVVTTVAGSGVAGRQDGPGTTATFSSPRGIVVSAAGVLYVTDLFNNLIRRIVPEGVVSTVAGSSAGYAEGAAFSAQFSTPWGIAIDATGNLLVGDYGNNRIRKLSP